MPKPCHQYVLCPLCLRKAPVPKNAAHCYCRYCDACWALLPPFPAASMQASAWTPMANPN